MWYSTALQRMFLLKVSLYFLISCILLSWILYFISFKKIYKKQKVINPILPHKNVPYRILPEQKQTFIFIKEESNNSIFHMFLASKNYWFDSRFFLGSCQIFWVLLFYLFTCISFFCFISFEELVSRYFHLSSTISLLLRW